MMEANAKTGKRVGQDDAASAAPAIVLVRPQLGENIGFAARAMGNFGLRDLRLVAPRDGWPNEKARATAAVADLNYVIATTARPREMVKEVLSPETAAAALRAKRQASQRTGVLFGAERSGLDNDSIVLADAILTAPVSAAFASLSLPQAVLLFAYEWLKSESPSDLGRTTTYDGPAREGISAPDTQPATRAELYNLFEHLEGALDDAGFLRPPEKRPSMVRSIRNMFHRMGATDQDVRTWRGIVSALTRPPTEPRR